MDFDHGTIVLEPQAEHSATIIFLHGLGDTANGWISEMRKIHKSYPGLKVILPTAPRRPVTINYGIECPAWYDIKSLSSRDKEDFEGIHETRNFIEKLIAQEVDSGLLPTRIIIGGFSQGAAVSMFTGYQHHTQLGGIIAMSGYLPTPDKIQVTEASKNTPLLCCHGTEDNVVKYDWGKKSFDSLIDTFGVNSDTATFKTYEAMTHSACYQEIIDVRNFIDNIYNKK
eukprot:CAMPEP_0174272374 /NCGR_PEP_ID=MMETSP0439-20130205/51005_1 /TAXON_ID=0 /ORGANISM="Stereomyxa ramosa, Strain Chinc5" /LENGTH=226 /DNA_ID=CAMNT_0015362895 /DNA_START=61 /DNA_END=741 /DNA_ORIENTATION=-